MSQIRDYGPLNPAHILKYTPGGSVETFLADAGTNGIAINAAGLLVTANHAVGGLVTYDPNASTQTTTIVDEYSGSRFNSPNDLTIRSDGMIFFTDPDWQCQGCDHQPVKGVYSVMPGGDAQLLTTSQDMPNGIALSPDEQTLYVGGSNLTSHTVNSNGTIGTGSGFGDGFFSSTDGLGMDCAGNVYVTTGSSVKVFSPSGSDLGDISPPSGQNVTNVAFGGANNTTLYITGFGSPGSLSTVELDIPGYPY
jgi:gluconolactonase